jgi:hypothetical protein
MRACLLAAPALALVLLTAACQNPQKPAGLQGMLGVGFYDLELEPEGVSTEVDVDNPFLMGFSVQQLVTPQNRKLDFGLEGGATVGIHTQEVSGVAGGSGAVIVIDSEVVLSDLFGGGFVSLDIGRQARLYAGAGPLLQYGWANFDQDDTSGTTDNDSSDSAAGVGYYARTGFEFRIHDGTMGVTVRWVDADLDFDDLDDADLGGLQLFWSYTRGL